MLSWKTKHFRTKKKFSPTSTAENCKKICSTLGRHENMKDGWHATHFIIQQAFSYNVSKVGFQYLSIRGTAWKNPFLHVSCMIFGGMKWKTYDLKSENVFRTMVRFVFSSDEKQFKYLTYKWLESNNNPGILWISCFTILGYYWTSNIFENCMFKLLVVRKSKQKSDHWARKDYSYSHVRFSFYSDKYHAKNMQQIGVFMPFVLFTNFGNQFYGWTYVLHSGKRDQVCIIECQKQKVYSVNKISRCTGTQLLGMCSSGELLKVLCTFSFRNASSVDTNGYLLSSAKNKFFPFWDRSLDLC